MRKSCVCVLVVFLSLALFTVSCGEPRVPATSSSAPATVAAVPTTTTGGPSATVAPTDSPQYGGILSIATTSSVFQWDEAFTMTTTTGGFTHNEPGVGDWAKGPAGTSEADWTYTGNDRLHMKTGAVVEKWEIPEVGRIVFHVRKDVHYGLNPNNEASRLVNGRELTADDVAQSLQRLCTEPRAYVKTAYPNLASTNTFTVLDKYTLEIISPAKDFPDALSQWFDRNHVIAPEVAKKYTNVNKWELQVGTGPFLLTDFVEGSSATLIRNSKYWERDPVGPGKGNQLPYADGVKLLVITDMSTAQAALRTSKIDQIRLEIVDDAEAVTKTVSGLQQKRYLEHGTQTISMHLYNPALPTSDIRVRRALFMATDLNGIKNGLYRGDAEIDTWPNPDLKEYHSAHLPLSEAPASVQELYTYNPEKAKALLKEAGFPNGFKAKIVCRNTTMDVDFLSAVKDMWSKVGVDLEIQPKEGAVYTSLWQQLSYEDMLLAGGMGIGGYYRMISFDTPSYWNPSQVNDAKVKETKVKVFELFNQQKIAEVDTMYKDLMKYVLDQAWYIPRPLPYSYVLWWPWMKGYHGELGVGWAGPSWVWVRYAWVDQELKEKVTGR